MKMSEVVNSVDAVLTDTDVLEIAIGLERDEVSPRPKAFDKIMEHIEKITGSKAASAALLLELMHTIIVRRYIKVMQAHIEATK